jgi:toxin-antitoxin system PIN domain toxin
VIVFLLDINVLLALFDPGHEHHTAAHHWYSGKPRWASCPLTENGFIRVASSPSYPGGPGNPSLVAEQLRAFQKTSDHVFWEDRLSLLDRSIYNLDFLKGPRQVTDVYLLGLAMHKGGKLATFDQSIPIEAVKSCSNALELVPGTTPI